MSILDRVSQARTTSEIPNKFASVANEIFGEKGRVEESRFLNQEVEELEPQDQYDDPNYSAAIASPFQASTNREYVSDFQKSNEYLRNDKYLRTLAKMEVEKQFFTASLKVEPVRIISGKVAEMLGKPELASKIRQQITVGNHEDFRELLEEVIFQEMKDLQRVNDLRRVTYDELMETQKMLMYRSLAGENYENLTELFDAGFKAIKTKFFDKK